MKMQQFGFGSVLNWCRLGLVILLLLLLRMVMIDGVVMKQLLLLCQRTLLLKHYAAPLSLMVSISDL